MREAIQDADNRGDAKTSRPPSAFGDVVRRLREARGMTQTKLAAKMGQSVSYISLVESGRRKPVPKLLSAILAALEVTSDEEAELRVAAGLPTSPLDTAVQYCIAALDEVVGLDALDSYLARRDLIETLNAWKATLQGKREMESGAFEAAHTSFETVAQNGALTPLLRANAYVCFADIQEKQGYLKDAQESMRQAQFHAQPLDASWQQALHGEINGVHGFFAARAGESHLAETLTKRGMRNYESLRDNMNESGRDAETTIIVKIGIANALSRLALKELFSGDADLGKLHAQSGQKELPAAPQRDIARTRLRLVALEAWAYAKKGEFAAALPLREAVLSEYEAMQDQYGIAKSHAYMADDSRAQVMSMLRDDSSKAVTPEERQQNVMALRMGPDISQFIQLLTQAIETYRKAIDGLKSVGDRILLARCWRNLGEMLHYQWLLLGRREDLDQSAACLDNAYQLEKGMSQGQPNKGRRLVSVLESQAKLAWDEGVLDRALDKYSDARKALNSYTVTSSDLAGETQRARIDEAIRIIQSRISPTRPSQAMTRNTVHGALGAGGSLAGPTPQSSASGVSASTARMWRRATERIEQMVVPKITTLLHREGGSAPLSELSVDWAKSLYDLELESGPRYLAQSSLSSFLSGDIFLTASPAAQELRKDRNRRIRENIAQARQTDNQVSYIDIFSTSNIEPALDTSRKTPNTKNGRDQGTQLDQAIKFLRAEEESYQVAAIPYDIPIAFAIKGNILLVKMRKELADDQGFNLTEPGEFACFRIEGDVDLIHEMSDVFASLLEIARLAERDGLRAIALLEDLRDDEAAPAVFGANPDL